MKKVIKQGLSALLVLLMIVSLTACGKPAEKDVPQDDPTSQSESAEQSGTSEQSGLWADAAYTEDQTFGDGSTTVQVEVQVEEQSVTFTIKTDKETLGDALLEHKLIEGEQGDYGLYVKVVNGITADYDIDQSYWSLCKDGEAMTVGVDGAAIADGEHYELVYMK